MSTATIAVIAENVVLLAAIITGGHLFRQGGGWQFKTPPVPKQPAPPKDKPAEQPQAADEERFSILGGKSTGEAA